MQRNPGMKLCCWLASVLWLMAFKAEAQSIFARQIPLNGEYKINAMVQDKFGFLWLGTDRGIVVYNGYDEELIPMVQSFEITCLQVKDGWVFAGTKSGQVFKIDANNHSLVIKLPAFTKSKISDIEVDHRMGLWIATYGDGVFKLSHDSLIKGIVELKSKDIYDLVIAHDKSVYIASDQGIDIVREKSNSFSITPISNLPDYIIVKLCKSARGTVVAATYDREIFEIGTDNSLRTLFENKDRNRNYSLFCADERLFIHSGNSILEWKNAQIISLQMQDIKDRISAVFVDDENNLWIAGGKSALYKSGMQFLQFSIPRANEIQAMEYDGNQYYLGTAKGVFLKKDLITGDGSWILKGENITTIQHIDRRVWIGTFSNGLFIYNPTNNKTQHIGKLLDTDDNTILDIEKTAVDLVQISTLAGIIPLAVNREGEPLPGKPPGHHGTLKAYVYDICSDHSGGVWYGKDRNGVTLNKLGKFTDWKEIVNKKDQKVYRLGSVFSIAEGRPGEMFFASTNLGLVRNRDGIWDISPKSFSLKNQIVGLTKLNEKYMLLIRNHSIEVMELETGHILPFSFNLQGDQGISFLNNFTAAQGDCYFALGNHLVRFSPGAALDKKHPVTRLDKVEVNLETIPQEHNVFEQHENNLRFSFTAGWLSNPSAVQYAYKLEGFDADWRYTGDRVVSYPHLNPSRYVFKVKASENKSFYDEPITVYSFEIKRAFYNTVWFYLGLGILTLAGIWAFQQRRRNVALLKSELARIKTESELINLKSQLDPHFLFNTFNTLIGLIEEDPPRGVRFTENLTQFFRLLSQSSQKELSALSEEIQLVETYANILKERFGKNVTILINPEVYNNSESAMVPPVTLQMLIENAVKHNEVSKAKPLTISISLENDYLKVSNEKHPKLSTDHSLGIGNKNIFERYRLMDLPLPFIKEDALYYNYYLPLIKKN